MDNFLNVTYDDLNDAGSYALQFVFKQRFHNQKRETRWILPDYEMVETPVTDEFYVPPDIPDATIVTLKFPEKSCAELSCFMDLPNGRTCAPDTPPQTFTISEHTFTACQKSCFANTKSGYPLLQETKFENGTCYRKNYLFKKWCLYPRMRSDNPVDCPAFKYWEKEEMCYPTYAYCLFYGLEYSSRTKDCYKSKEQEIVEDYITGKTIYRQIATVHKTSIPKRFKRETFTGLLKDFFIDSSIPAAAMLMEHISVKSLAMLDSQAITLLMNNLQSKYGIAVAKMSTVSLILKQAQLSINLQIAMKAANILTSLSSGVGWVLLALNISGLLLDLIDPMKLQNLLTVDEIKAFKETLDDNFSSMSTSIYEITPLALMNLYSDAQLSLEEMSLFKEKSSYYLSKLQVSSKGQRVHISSDVVRQNLESIKDLLSEANQKFMIPAVKVQMDKYFNYFAFAAAILIPLYLVACT